MTSPGIPFPRAEYRRLRRDWVGRQPRTVVVAVGVLVLLAGSLTAVLLVPHYRTPLTYYLLGVVQMGIVGATAHLLPLCFLAADERAIHQMRGAWGEENTRDELRRARRRGLIWGWVDAIALSNGDIDHLVVTRRGGVVAIDSKWRNVVARAASTRWTTQRD